MVDLQNDEFLQYNVFVMVVRLSLEHTLKNRTTDSFDGALIKRIIFINSESVRKYLFNDDCTHCIKSIHSENINTQLHIISS